MDAVLRVALPSLSIDAGAIGFVLAEQRLSFLFRDELVVSQFGVGCMNDSVAELLAAGLPPGELWTERAVLAGPWIVSRGIASPGVAIPETRQQVEGCVVGTAIFGRNPDEHIFGPGLRVLDEDVEVAVVVEDACVQQLVLHLAAGATAVGRHQVFIG